MNNREWLYSLDVADLADWFDAEHAEPRKVNMKRYFKPFIEAAQRAIDVENDSREKLEDDVVHECARPGFGPEFGEIMAWLDRQAAITAEETSDAWEEYRNATQREIAELTAERDALADDLLTCNKEREEYRELFSEALTLAAEIVNLQP